MCLWTWDCGRDVHLEAKYESCEKNVSYNWRCHARRSDGEGEDLESEIKDLKAQGEELGEKLNTVHIEIPEQGDSLSEALNGVELD
jgi:archaellum component FlaC